MSLIIICPNKIALSGISKPYFFVQISICSEMLSKFSNRLQTKTCRPNPRMPLAVTGTSSHHVGARTVAPLPAARRCLLRPPPLMEVTGESFLLPPIF
jgi:hypothetical protein